MKPGGRDLSRSGNTATLEGDDKASSLVALIAFPDRDALDAFLADPDYASFARAGQAGSVSHFHAIDDTDLAGTNPYLAAG